MKLISLTQGLFAKVANPDYKYLSRFKWYACKQKEHGTYYAMRNSRRSESEKRSKVMMHRFVLNVTDPKIFIYHKDRDGLNCTKRNLQKATLSQIAMRRRHVKEHTSKYLGVSLKTNRNTTLWQAVVMVNQKCVYHKYFDSEIEAAEAYNKIAKRVHGKFATLNVITK